LSAHKKIHVKQDPFQPMNPGPNPFQRPYDVSGPGGAYYGEGAGYPGLGYPNQSGNGPYPFPAAPKPPGAGPLSNIPIQNIMAFVDRMGGIDGILSRVEKAQKLMKSIQQMAPMIRLVMGSFAPTAKTTDRDNDLDDYPRRRKKRRKKGNKRTTKKRLHTRSKNGLVKVR
jgi:hypothetical protein